MGDEHKIKENNLDEIIRLAKELTEEEAKSRYAKYRDKDPFPKITPSLLNSADFTDYILNTGMLSPFLPDKDTLKPATYEIPILGICIYWDKKGKRKEKPLLRGHEFVLEKNSIAYVSLEPRFRIPFYMVLRFNLKVKHVYKGLLLGTGPLIDPGFEGLLSIPLHNLTNNDYIFKGGEPLIGLEFTKLSTNSRWGSQEIEPDKKGIYIPFKSSKNETRKNVSDFLHGAVPNGSVVSSLTEIENKVESAKKTVNRIRNWGIAAICVAFLTVLGIVIGSCNVVMSSMNVMNKIQQQQTEMEKIIAELKAQKNQKLELIIPQDSIVVFNQKEGQVRSTKKLYEKESTNLTK
jgi:hypothetical protein